MIPDPALPGGITPREGEAAITRPGSQKNLADEPTVECNQEKELPE
jgi:hypothetical protein